MIDTRPLDQLIKALKDEDLKCRIGILGSKNARAGDGGETNAEIGLKHEFGDPTGKPPLPIRSFLRVPLADNLGRYLEKAGAFDEAALKEVVRSGTVRIWLQKIGIVAESVVLDGFASGGFGKWVPSNMKYKKVWLTLIETNQLRDSIQSEVK